MLALHFYFLSMVWPLSVTHGLTFVHNFQPVMSVNEYFMTQTHENHQYIISLNSKIRPITLIHLLEI